MKSSIRITLPCETNSTNSVIRSAQAGQRDRADDDAGGAGGDADTDHVARAVVRSPARARASRVARMRRRARAAEKIEQRALGDHQHDQHHDRPERRQRRRHLLDHQAPDQHADRQQEVQAGAHRRPGVERARRVDIDVLRQVRARRRLLDREEVERRQPPRPWPTAPQAPRNCADSAPAPNRARRRRRCCPRCRDRSAARAHARSRRARDDRPHAELHRLEVDDVEEPDVGERSPAGTRS